MGNHQGLFGKYDRADNDWYVEPEWAVEALLDHVKFGRGIWDPFCGRGTIPKVFRKAGYRVTATDIVDRGCPDAHCMDFLKGNLMGPGEISDIVCNPPYKMPELHDIIRWSILYAERKVAMLLPLRTLCSEARYNLFQTTPVSKVLILSGRPSMPPGPILEESLRENPDFIPTGGKVDFMWLIWDHNHRGAVTIEWVNPHIYSNAAAIRAVKARKETME